MHSVNGLMSTIRPPFLLALFLFLGAYLVIFQPGYVTNDQYLGMLIFLQILVAVVWNYRQRFFPFLIVIFFSAGTAVPLQAAMTSGRWFVLGTGALVGAIICSSERERQRQRLGMLHMMAFFCILAAFCSSFSSLYPDESLLKALSFFILLLYAAFGARLAVVGREARFFSGLLLGCELLIYVTAIAYFLLRYQFFGNPNSLGAVMGVVAVPVMLWGVLITESMPGRNRRIFALLLATVLLLSSYARAGILAATASCILLCVALCRYRLLLKFASVAIVSAFLVATIAPRQGDDHRSVASTFVYKGHPESGVLASRKSAWDETLSSVQEHPWFGTGFGTSATAPGAAGEFDGFASDSKATREHGNSYLEIIEWVGILGAVPFFVLLLLTAVNVGKVLVWLRRSRNPMSPAVPIAVLVGAGLVHAGFEDWLFAAGYYLCVLFWALTFVLFDFVPLASPTSGIPAR